jgi:hypothetical protein
MMGEKIVENLLLRENISSDPPTHARLDWPCRLIWTYWKDQNVYYSKY